MLRLRTFYVLASLSLCVANSGPFRLADRCGLQVIDFLGGSIKNHRGGFHWIFLYEAPGEDAKCYVRHAEDAESFPACSARCADLSTAFSAKQPACFTRKNLEWFQSELAQPRLFLGNEVKLRFAWSRFQQLPGAVEPAGGWEGAGCPADAASLWGEGEPSNSAVGYEIYNDEFSGYPVGLDLNCSMYVMGNGVLPAGVEATVPFMADVSCNAPNPSDVWCLCEYEPAPDNDILPPATSPASPPPPPSLPSPASPPSGCVLGWDDGELAGLFMGGFGAGLLTCAFVWLVKRTLCPAKSGPTPRVAKPNEIGLSAVPIGTSTYNPPSQTNSA